MAAVLSCGADARLSHESAGELWGFRWQGPGVAGEAGRADKAIIEVTVPAHVMRHREGIRVHRRKLPGPDRADREGIPITSPIRTLLDLATRHPRSRLEAAVNEADRLGLLDPETLRSALDERARWPGVAPLRALLDRSTCRLTDSELERRFLPLARRAGLPPPLTGCLVNGFKVDFFWPELGLTVETDGLRYHRTAAQQARDRLRDQTHTAAGLTPMRFTHAQVRDRPRWVVETLAAVARRLAPR